MRILFTKLRHIGDNLLVTPTIVATRKKHPDAEIWLAVRRGTEGILAGCPEIDRIVVTARPEEGRRTSRELVSDLAATARIATAGFDYAFELGDNDRGRTLVLASRARVRCTNAYERPEGEPLTGFWKGCFNHPVTTGHGPVHQVLRDYNAVRKALSLPEDPPPLRFAAEFRRLHGLPLPTDEPYAVVHPATRWASKAWSTEHWKIVVAELLERFPRVVVSCGPDPAEISVAETLRTGNEECVLTTGGMLGWTQVAGLLGSASLFVGVDTAAMHLAASTGCPSVALFGNPPAYQFRPWKVPHRVVRSRDEMPERERILIPGEQLMDEITAGAVLEAIEGFLTELRQDPTQGRATSLR